jgi:hypothetical protein
MTATPETVRRGMKAKTIKKIFRKLLDSWLETIDDPTTKELAAKNTIITGGSIASMLLGEPINDFDFYFRNIETTRAIAKYYVSKFKPETSAGIPCNIYVHEEDGRIMVVIKSAGIASEEGTETPYEYFEGRPPEAAEGYVGEVMTDPGEIEDTYEETEKLAQEAKDEGKAKYRPVFMSTNAITLSHRVQVILRFYGEPDVIHANYDFVHCTNHWASWTDELVLRPQAMEALLTRELRYVGSKYPICSLIRLRKFIKRGWTVNAGQILKMVMQASELDLKDIRVMQDQLTGVDAAYFIQLMQKLKENDPEKINTAYLVEIIDRMF